MNAAPNTSTPHAVCAAAVDRLCTRCAWSLLPRDELIRRTQQRLRSGRARDATYAVTEVYAAVLYAACSGVEGDARCAQGYRELHRWLYAIAYRHYPEVAAEATQQALERVHTRFVSCREPGTFLMFALANLCAAACQLRIHSSVEKSVR